MAQVRVLESKASFHTHEPLNDEPQRDILDFNPVLEQGRGIVGRNYLHKADEADVELVVSEQDPFIKNKQITQKCSKFTPVDKRDRPFTKNTQHLRQEQK